MEQGRVDGAQAFADVARALQSEGNAQETIQRIVDLAPELIEHCEHAGITMVVSGQVMTPAASGPVPIAVDKIQYEANQGPCLDAMRKHAVFVTDDLAAETRWPDFAARAAAETGIRSMLSLRLFLEEDTLGSLNLYSGVPAAFGSEAAATGGVFAAHAAVALASARQGDRADRLAGDLASSERRGVAMAEQVAAAAVLQHSMLSVLPDIDGLELGARYHPAVAVAQVGGDWYDAFSVSEETLSLVIGDVVGHDMDAAVQMAQLRNLLRSLAFDRRGRPSDILARLDRMTAGLGVVETATCIYAVMDRKGPARPWRLRFANAGHPAPLLVSEGRGRYLDTDEHVLLGFGADASRTDRAVTLPPGATLLLYTDGLVERPGQSIEDGLAKLCSVATSLEGHSIDDFCDSLLAELADQALDDVCMLAVRTVPDRTG